MSPLELEMDVYPFAKESAGWAIRRRDGVWYLLKAIFKLFRVLRHILLPLADR
jgi:hypothetical protein